MLHVKTTKGPPVRERGRIVQVALVPQRAAQSRNRRHQSAKLASLAEKRAMTAMTAFARMQVSVDVCKGNVTGVH